jgi:hypothetical protein
VLLGEDEDHPGVLRERLAVHEPDGALSGGVGHLHVDGDLALPRLDDHPRAALVAAPASTRGDGESAQKSGEDEAHASMVAGASGPVSPLASSPPTPSPVG